MRLEACFDPDRFACLILPYQGLDSVNRSKVLTLLETIAKAAGQWMAMLYVTHYEDENPATTTHVLELEKGKIKFSGIKTLG